MSTFSPRRLLAVLPPIAALVALAWLGHRGAPVAVAASPTLAPSSSIDVSTDASANASIEDAEASLEGGDTADAMGERRAVEELADGAVIVDINRASERELRRLPGIGVVRARSIIDLRARLGRFKSIDDWVRIKGMGRAILRRLRPLVRT